MPLAAHSRHSQSSVARRCLICRQKLKKTALVLRKRRGGGVGHFEKESNGSGRVHAPEIPSMRAPAGEQCKTKQHNSEITHVH
jgi:hypothetical protein